MIIDFQRQSCMLKIWKNCRFQRHSAHCVYFEMNIETIFDYSDDSIANIVNYNNFREFYFFVGDDVHWLTFLTLPSPLSWKGKIRSSLVTRYGSETFLSRLKWNPDTAQSRIMSGVWAVSTWVPNIRFRAVSMSRLWHRSEPILKPSWDTQEPLLFSFNKHFENFFASAEKGRARVRELSD